MWSSTVVPTGMPLRGPDMSIDMRPAAVSEETAGSDGSDPLAVSSTGPLGLCEAASASPGGLLLFGSAIGENKLARGWSE